MVKIKTSKLKCRRCGHEWMPRGTEVNICPKCKTPYWDIEVFKEDGEGIKKLRESLGQTQENFAHSIGVSWRTVSRWEREISKPQSAYLRKINKLAKSYEGNDGDKTENTD